MSFNQEHLLQQWLESALETTRLLLGKVDRHKAMRLVTERTRSVAGADYAAIVSADPAYPEGTIAFEAVDGLGLEHLDGTPVPKQSVAGAVIDSGISVVSQDIALEEDFDPPPPAMADALSVLGHGMCVPLTAGGTVLGALFVGWRRESPHENVSAQEVQLVEMFAGHAALALQQVQASLPVIEDRDRIAHDLRDVVIDRLFAIGTNLRGIAGLVSDGVEQRMNEAIDDLDETTQQIRSAIFALDEDPPDQRPVSDQVLDEIDAARATLGFTPRLVIHGPVDNSLPPHLQRELIWALRETLSNAASHAAPNTVEVCLQVTEDRLTLTVTENGHLTQQSSLMPALHGALAQLRTRAQHLGGSCTVRATEPNATIVEWHVPLAL